MSSRHTLTDTPWIMFNQISGHVVAQSTWHIKLTVTPYHACTSHTALHNMGQLSRLISSHFPPSALLLSHQAVGSTSWSRLFPPHLFHLQISDHPLRLSSNVTSTYSWFLSSPPATAFLIVLPNNEGVFLLLFSCFLSLKITINYYNKNLSEKATPSTTCIPSLVFVTRFVFHTLYSPWAWSYGALLMTVYSWLCFVVGAANLWIK